MMISVCVCVCVCVQFVYDIVAAYGSADVPPGLAPAPVPTPSVLPWHPTRPSSLSLVATVPLTVHNK